MERIIKEKDFDLYLDGVHGREEVSLNKNDAVFEYENDDVNIADLAPRTRAMMRTMRRKKQQDGGNHKLELDIAPHPERRSGGIHMHRVTPNDDDGIAGGDVSFNDLEAVVVLEGDAADDAFDMARKRNQAQYESDYRKVDLALNAAKSLAKDLLEKDERDIVFGINGEVDEVDEVDEGNGVDGTDGGEGNDEIKRNTYKKAISFEQPKLNDVYAVSKWLSEKFSMDIDSKTFLEYPYQHC